MLWHQARKLQYACDKEQHEVRPMRPSAPLSPEALYTPCDPAALDFPSTEALPDLEASQIHGRALEAMHLGLDMPHAG